MLTTLPGILRAYCEAYPRVRLHLHESFTSRVIEGLENGTLDAGILRDGDPAKSLVVKTISSEPFVAVLPANHPRANRRASPLLHCAMNLSCTIHEAPAFALSRSPSHYSKRKDFARESFRKHLTGSPSCDSSVPGSESRSHPNVSGASPHPTLCASRSAVLKLLATWNSPMSREKRVRLFIDLVKLLIRGSAENQILDKVRSFGYRFTQLHNHFEVEAVAPVIVPEGDAVLRVVDVAVDRQRIKVIR